jgi:hypothetical protein
MHIANRIASVLAGSVVLMGLTTTSASAGVFGTVANDLPGSYTLMTAEWEKGGQTCNISGVGDTSCKAQRLGSGKTTGFSYDADLFMVSNSDFRVRHSGGTVHTFRAGVYYQIHDTEKAHCWLDTSSKPYCYVD